MKDNHFFGFIFAIFFVMFFYTLFPVPFILKKSYWNSAEFNIVFTIGSFCCLIFSIINNGFLIHILRKNSQILGPANCFYIVMLLADLLFPWFYLPLGMVFSWIHHSDLWQQVNFEALIDWSRVMSSFLYSFVSLSINSFAVCCIFRFYLLFTRSNDLKGFWRVIAGIMLSALSITMFSINQVYSEEKFTHSLISAFAAFLPFTITFVTILLTFWLNKYNQINAVKNDLSNKLLYGTLLSYFMFWIPMFTVSNIHMYHERIEFEHYSRLTYVTPMLLVIKSPCNILVAILTNKTIRKEIRHILCCCCQSNEENNNERCIYYTNSGGETFSVVNGEHVVLTEEPWSDTKVLIEE